MSRSFSLADYGPKADGFVDDTPALQRCFAAAARGGTIVIPPDDYFVTGRSPVPISSGTTVLAHGARFHLPATLRSEARLVLFAGRDVADFAWHGGINQPQRLVMQGNVFVNNTTKGERDPWRGRKSYETGDYQAWPELYFTLHEPEGHYGPVILRDNIFVTGPECREAVAFARNGHDLLVEGNVFSGPVRTVRVEPGCTNVHVGTNLNMEKACKPPI